MYNNKVIELFENPQNTGKILKPDAVGKAGNLEDGDIIKLFLNVSDGEVEEIKFEAFGCVSAIACASAVTLIALGKSVKLLSKITKDTIIDYLGGLPAGKEHGAILAEQALKECVKMYEKRLAKGDLQEHAKQQVKVEKVEAKADKKAVEKKKTNKDNIGKKLSSLNAKLSLGDGNKPAVENPVAQVSENSNAQAEDMKVETSRVVKKTTKTVKTRVTTKRVKEITPDNTVVLGDNATVSNPLIEEVTVEKTYPVYTEVTVEETKPTEVKPEEPQPKPEPVKKGFNLSRLLSLSKKINKKDTAE